MKKRDVLNSPQLLELKRKRRRNLHKKVFLFVFLFTSFFVGLVFIARTEKLNIKDVRVVGNSVIATEDIEKAVEEVIAGEYLYFLPKTNFIFYPKGKITRELEQSFKRLGNISIKFTQGQALEVSVSEREGRYTWCGEAIREEASLRMANSDGGGEQCYFMDESGYVFDVAPYFSGDVYFRFYGPLAHIEEEYAGNYFLPGIFAKILSFKSNLEAMNLRPASLLAKDNGDMEIYLSSTILPPNGPKIIFKSKSDYESIAENLQTALDTEPFKTSFKTKFNMLSYIDLRFGNRVYYKFTDGSGNEE